jgi:hypothetical protein
MKCKHCGSDYLHIEKVEVFCRKEDAEIGLHFVINNNDFDYNECFSITNNDLKGNPSERRGGLTIKMKCENCGDFTTFSLAQHKGNLLQDIV